MAHVECTTAIVKLNLNLHCYSRFMGLWWCIRTCKSSNNNKNTIIIVLTITISWNKYQSKVSIERQKQYLD